MANTSSLLLSFFNILLIKFSSKQSTIKKTKSSSVDPVESNCADDGGEIQIRASYPLWNKLDNDILDLIIAKLDLFSRIYFSAVCRSWRLAIEEARTPDAVLRLLPRNPYSEHLTFSDFHTGALHQLDLPNSVKGKWSWCITSSDGRWIVVITSYRKLIRNPVEISLFDPISRLLVRLPKINDSRIRESITRSRKKRDVCLLNSKFEMFSVGSQNIIVLLFDGWYLGFCKSSGKKWFQFRKFHHEGGYNDICFINGALYVLTSNLYGMCNERDSNIGAAIQTLSMKFEGLEITVKLVPYTRPRRGRFSITNFVNLNGGLLRVKKICDDTNDLEEEEKDEAMRYLFWRRPSEFVLTKFEHRGGGGDDDGSTMICTEVGSGLGDEALLFSQCNCICIPAKKFKGVDENCIYFLNDYWGQMNLACNEFGVCHMDNGRIESASPCFPKVKDGHGLYCWFLPHIKKKRDQSRLD